MTQPLSRATASEHKKVSDVVKWEVNPDFTRSVLPVGVGIGLNVGDIVELISAKYEKIVTAANAHGIFLQNTRTELKDAIATLTFGGVPIADELVTVNGRAYKFVAAPSADDDVDIAGDAAGCLNNLMNAVNGSTGTGASVEFNPGTPVAHATVTAEVLPGDKIQFRSLIPGVVGNAYTLTTDVTLGTVSGATFSGGQGVDPTNGVILLRGGAIVDGTQLAYNGTTKATVDAALLVLGIQVVG